jgi:hypothetical protein
MVVEGGDLVDLGERHAHFLRERRQVRGSQVAVSVLNAVQVLDQQVAPTGRAAEQPAHLPQRVRVDAASLGRGTDFALHGDGASSLCDPLSGTHRRETLDCGQARTSRAASIY